MKIELISKKTEATDAFKAALTRYLINFMHNLFNEHKLSEFQKKLFDIPVWSERKSDKEFKRFLKYIYKKKRLTEQELNELIMTILHSSVKLMTESPIEITECDIRSLWYKLLKLTGKFFYDKIKTQKEVFDYSDNEKIDQFIEMTLEKCIPLQTILDTPLEIEAVKYNFGRERKQSHDLNGNLDLQSFDELPYVSVEQFYLVKPVKEKEITDEQNDIKEIKIKSNLLL